MIVSGTGVEIVSGTSLDPSFGKLVEIVGALAVVGASVNTLGVKLFASLDEHDEDC